VDDQWLYYLWAGLLVIACVAAWLTTFFALPGNWIVVLLAGLFALFVPAAEGRGVSWTVVGVAAGLAVVGEILEFAAGAAGAAKKGASRRGMALALLGTVVGSVVGATMGVPIPLVGPLVGALGGGALGAFGGAYLGESSLGRSHPESVAAGQGALVGRLLGTVGKLMVGAVIVVIVAFDAFI
jgi:uncharacterized protein YqgC (DUF456 family)